MTENEMIQAQQWRYATKIFDSQRKLSAMQVKALEDCLRLTPTSFGLQAMGFVWVDSPELRKSLRAASWNQAQVEQASHHLVLCRSLEFGEKDVDDFVALMAQTRGVQIESLQGYRKSVMGFVNSMNAEQKTRWLDNQVYIALGNLMTTAAALGIDACPMEGLSRVEYDRILNLPEKNLTTVVACPLGYRDLQDKYASMPKVRWPAEKLFTSL